MEKLLGASKIYKGGISIYTTLNLDLQEAAQTAVDDGLRPLQTRMKANNILPADPQAALVGIDIDEGLFGDTVLW